MQQMLAQQQQQFLLMQQQAALAAAGGAGSPAPFMTMGFQQPPQMPGASEQGRCMFFLGGWRSLAHAGSGCCGVLDLLTAGSGALC